MPAVGELTRYVARDDLNEEELQSRGEDLSQVFGRFAVLEADQRVFTQWGIITANLPGPTSDRARLHIDALIAATGLAHDMTVATTNMRDFNNFTRFGVRLYDPSKYQRPDLA